jgi:fumarate reductase flavoprotein subunit
MIEAGAVAGVRYQYDGTPCTLRGRCGVILAAGDYANSPEMIGRHKGDRFTGVEGIDVHSTGDGHRLAQQAGASLVNMDVTYGPELRFIAPRRRTFLELLPSRGPLARLVGHLMPHVPAFILRSVIQRLLVTWQHPENALFDDGAILLNSEGQRFCNEKMWPDREIAVAGQPGKQAYILLDSGLIERYSRWPHFISTAPKIAYAYVNDYLRLRPDVAIAGPLESIASSRAMPLNGLGEAIAAYNAYVSGEAPDALGRTNDKSPLNVSQWVLLGPVKAYFTTTEGGAAINAAMQVLDDAGQPIEGLYAAGQNGLGGQILWGHGLHIAWAITSGRLAGKAVVQGPRRRP